MKKAILFLFLSCILLSCSDNDNEQDDPTTGKQNYTSFVVINEASDATTKGCVVGYKDGDTWTRVATLGNVIGTKESKETKIDFNKFQEVTIFRDYTKQDYTNSAVVIMKYTLKKNKKNVLKIPNIYDGSTIVKKDNPNLYPTE